MKQKHHTHTHTHTHTRENTLKSNSIIYSTVYSLYKQLCHRLVMLNRLLFYKWPNLTTLEKNSTIKITTQIMHIHVGPENSKPTNFITSYLRQILTDFVNSFTCTLSSAKWQLKIPPPLKCFATLPCEYWYLTQLWQNLGGLLFGPFCKKVRCGFLLYSAACKILYPVAYPFRRGRGKVYSSSFFLPLPFLHFPFLSYPFPFPPSLPWESGSRGPSEWGSGVLPMEIFWNIKWDLAHSDAFWRRVCGSSVSPFVNSFCYQRWGGAWQAVPPPSPLNTPLLVSVCHIDKVYMQSERKVKFIIEVNQFFVCRSHVG